MYFCRAALIFTLIAYSPSMLLRASRVSYGERLTSPRRIFFGVPVLGITPVLSDWYRIVCYNLYVYLPLARLGTLIVTLVGKLLSCIPYLY